MTRCRMHGGSAGTGAPLGNQNALKHGLSTREFKSLGKAANAWCRASRKLLDEIS